MPHCPDVLILGASVAGVSAAISLLKKGFDVLLIERDAEVKERFKGEYLQPFAVSHLEELGLGSVVHHPKATHIRRLRFRDIHEDGDRVGAEIEIHYPKGKFALVLPHKELVTSLRAAAQDILREQFLIGATVEPTNKDSSDFHLHPEFLVKKMNGESLHVKPKWVLGCDGRQSSVRKWMGGAQALALGSATVGSAPEFIVGCELKGAHHFSDRYEVIRTTGQGTLAVFRLSDESRRCYWSTTAKTGNNSKKDWLPQVSSALQDTQNLLPDLEASGFENLAGAPADTNWLGPAANGRFFLLGDALAITTPFGGQGMSCASHHVRAITKLLEASNSMSLKQMDKKYTEECRHWYNHVSLINFGLYYLFFAQATILKAASRHVFNRWNKNPEMMNRVGRLFGGIDLDTPNPIELMTLWGVLPVMSPVIPLGSRLARRAFSHRPRLLAYGKLRRAKVSASLSRKRAKEAREPNRARDIGFVG
jgi:2-polyprenyl-6-methoxyphenol hydroxylase-like FAD-dependent oxidoreductase